MPNWRDKWQILVKNYTFGIRFAIPLATYLE